jgi:hypothetical protein
MRRSAVLACTFALVLLAGALYLRSAPTNDDIRDQHLREIIANSQSEFPQRGLGHDWLDCLTRYWSDKNKAADRVVCETWTQQGVTSSLIALQLGEQRIPVVESRLAGVASAGPVVLDIQGGPGGVPFLVSEDASDERISNLRRRRMDDWRPEDIGQSPYKQLLERGYTIASIGYWGMNLRTLNTPDEFALAAEDVRLAVDYYRDKNGADLPLITVSLGNHLALAALGKERIQEMDVLALVPVMDGLQHHLKRALSAKVAEKEKAESEGHLYGDWAPFNIYKRSSDGLRFDQSRMLPFDEFVSRFIGKADFPWKGITPRRPCSKVVLGSKDPRTLEHLASVADLPDFVIALDADHNLFKDAPDRSQALFAEFADCIASRGT